MSTNRKKLLSPLFYSLLICLLSCTSNSIEKEDKAVFVKKTPAGYQMFRNGEPFYIKGAGAKSNFALLKSAGANTVRIYDTLNLKKTLDLVHEQGLAAIVDLPFPRYDKEYSVYEDNTYIEKHSDAIRKIVLDHKDHPSLLFWMLGNEILYPYIYGKSDFYTHFNGLIDMIHEVDKNHPVSTALVNFVGYRFMSINLRSPKLDFISLNIFGALNSLEDKKKNFTFVMNKPYFISEWRVNGPWEDVQNIWGAPLEKNSTDKAWMIRDRYRNFIEGKKNCLGSSVFYWSTKQETTPTWFSLFTDKAEQTQAVFELENVWKNKTAVYKGPQIQSLGLNGSNDVNTIFTIDENIINAQVAYTNFGNNSLQFRWEIQPENWFYKAWDNEMFLTSLDEYILHTDKNTMLFKVPDIEGAYRVYVYITDEMNNVATANIPFYVLNPPKELNN